MSVQYNEQIIIYLAIEIIAGENIIFRVTFDITHFIKAFTIE